MYICLYTHVFIVCVVFARWIRAPPISLRCGSGVGAARGRTFGKRAREVV